MPLTGGGNGITTGPKIYYATITRRGMAVLSSSDGRKRQQKYSQHAALWMHGALDGKILAWF